MPEPLLTNPFPGLRPYQDYEASLFFGRKHPAAQIIEKLGDQRFIAVVGTSGSGKSSIVNCGVLPALYAGFYLPRGSRWRVVRTEPGGEPIRRLAARVSAALADRLGAESGNGHGTAARPIEHITALSEAILRYGEEGLVNLVRQARLPRSDNVLIVVDQFEELFRYRDQHLGPNEARDFVNLLLRAAEDEGEHIHVMLTMRSDFLGDCMLIPGLPEAINDGLFLVPAMSRDEREQAVRGPIKVAGAEIANLLVGRILDDIGDELDQLPLLQHALMRTWQEWEADAREAGEITLRHYLATVRDGPSVEQDPMAGSETTVIERSLDYHAEAVWQSLTPAQQTIARKIFQAITEVDEHGRRGRRPRRLGPPIGGSDQPRQDLAFVTSVPEDELIPVIEVFRASDRSFLKPEPRQELGSGTVVGEDLHSGSVIDVWHESLIRNWSTLHDWMDEEARDAEIYTDLAKETGREKPSLTRAKLQTAIEWAERRLADAGRAGATEGPWAPIRRRGLGLSANEVAAIEPWVSKYAGDASRGPSFEQVIRFVRKKVREWAAIRYGVRAAAVAVVAGLLVLVAWQRNATHDQQRAARAQLAGSLVDPLLSALVVSELRENPPNDLWLLDLFGSAKPPGIDMVGRSISGAGIPAAALLDDSILGEVGMIAFDPGGDTVIVVSTAGYNEQILAWPATGRGTPRTIWTSASVKPLNMVITPAGDLVGRFSDGSLRRLASSSDSWESVATLSDSAREVLGAADNLGIASDISRDSGHVAVVYRSGSSSWLAVWRSGRTAAGDSLVLALTVADDGTDLVVFSEDGTQLATAAGNTATVWSLATGDQEVCEGHRGEIESVAFSPDGRRMVTAGADRVARIWNVRSETGTVECTDPVVLTPHLGSVNQAVFSPDGHQVVTVSDDGIVRLWDVSSDSVPWPIELKGHQAAVVSAWFSPDGRSVLTASADGDVRMWDLERGRQVRSLFAGTDTARVVFSPAGRSIVTAAANGGVRVWSAEAREIVEPPRLPKHGGTIRALAHARSDTLVVTGASDGSVMAYDLTERRAIGGPLSVGPAPVVSVAIGPNDRWIAASSGSEARIWSVSDLAAGDTVPGLAPHDSEITSLTFSSDGRLFTGAEDGIVREWNVGDRVELVATLDPPDGGGSVLTVAADPDLPRILVGYDGLCGRLLSVEPGSSPREIWTSPEEGIGECALAVSPAGGRFATGEERTIRIWHDRAVQPLVEFEYPEDGAVRQLLFSPDGLRLVAYDTASSAAVVIWDVRSRVEVDRLVPDSGAVTGIGIGRDGNLRVWSTSADSSAAVWPVPWREMLESLRQETTACLTRPQRIAFFGESESDVESRVVARCSEATASPPSHEAAG